MIINEKSEMKKYGNLIKVIILPFIISFFSSCQSSSKKNVENKNELHTSLSSVPPSLDPRIASDSISECLMQMLFTGLTYCDANNQIQLAIADKVVISENQKTYIFTLKETRWSDGSPLTAFDFERGWKQQLRPDFPSPSAHLLYLIKGAREAKAGQASLESVGVKAMDEKTLIIELEMPTSYFLEVLAFHAFYPIPSSLDKGIYANEVEYSSFISCGPFKLQKYQNDRLIVLQKNEHYWDADRTALQGVHFHVISDPNTALLLFEKGELDWLGAPLSELPTEAISALKQKNLLHVTPIAGLKMLLFNTEKVPFNNANIRKALSIAIDRQSIIDNIVQLNNVPALGLIPPVQKQERWHPLFHDHDLAQARELFTKGLKELNMNSEDLPELVISFNNSLLWNKVIQAIQQQWLEAFNLPCKIEHCDWKVHLNKIENGNFQIGRYGWACQYNDPENLFELFKSKEHFNNPTGWQHADYITYIDRARNASDKKTRNELLESAELIFTAEMPIIPLFYDQCAYVQHSNLKGVYVTPLLAVDFRFAYFETNSRP
ncbi:MAG: peptide ABC transporter substrate-binding protein [Rhabdochlamydiaceae bacterium]